MSAGDELRAARSLNQLLTTARCVNGDRLQASSVSEEKIVVAEG